MRKENQVAQFQLKNAEKFYQSINEVLTLLRDKVNIGFNCEKSSFFRKFNTIYKEKNYKSSCPSASVTMREGTLFYSAFFRRSNLLFLLFGIKKCFYKISNEIQMNKCFLKLLRKSQPVTGHTLTEKNYWDLELDDVFRFHHSFY